MSTTQRNFWNPFTPVLYFYDFLARASDGRGHSYFENWCLKISTGTSEDMLLTNFGVNHHISIIGFVLFSPSLSLLTSYYLGFSLFISTGPSAFTGAQLCQELLNSKQQQTVVEWYIQCWNLNARSENKKLLCSVVRKYVRTYVHTLTTIAKLKYV